MNNSVSIVITAYNREGSLERSVRSALVQGSNLREVIIVDDGSTDGTPLVAEALVAADSRVRSVRLDVNQGASAARNRGIAEARGEYVLVWDSDDLLDPGALDTLVQAFVVEPELCVVSAPARMVRGNQQVPYTKRPSGHVSLEQVLCKYVGNDEKVRLARADAYRKAPYVSRNIDFIVAARLRDQGGWLHLENPLGTVFVNNPDSLTRARKKFNRYKSAERAPHLEAFLKDFGAKLKVACPRRYAEILYGTSVALACANRRSDSFALARELVKERPFWKGGYVALLLALFLPRR